MAHNFVNIQFEESNGQPAELTSANPAPYLFGAGQVLVLNVSNNVVSLNFNSSDGASAADMVAAVTAQTSEVVAIANPDETLTIRGVLKGEEHEVEVIGGSANTLIGLPEQPAYGVTEPGPPAGWTVTSVSPRYEGLEFGSSIEPYVESFEDTYGTGDTEVSYENLQFDNSTPFEESFEDFTLSAVLQGEDLVFDDILPFVEDFGTINLTPTQEDLTPDSFEFTPNIAFEDLTFNAGADTVEDWENFQPGQFWVQAFVPGQPVTIEIDTTGYTLSVAQQAGLSEQEKYEVIAALINAAGQNYTAVALGGDFPGVYLYSDDALSVVTTNAVLTTLPTSTSDSLTKHTLQDWIR